MSLHSSYAMWNTAVRCCVRVLYDSGTSEGRVDVPVGAVNGGSEGRRDLNVVYFKGDSDVMRDLNVVYVKGKA